MSDLTAAENQRIRDALRAFIEREGVTPAECARRLSMSQPTVSNFLNGRHGMGFKSALRVAVLLRVDIGDLLGRAASLSTPTLAPPLPEEEDPLEQVLLHEAWWGDGPAPSPSVAGAIARDARALRNKNGPDGAIGARLWRQWLREELQRRLRPDKAVSATVVDGDDLGRGLAAVPKLPPRGGRR